jgi:hypothetical protein
LTPTTSGRSEKRAEIADIVCCGQEKKPLRALGKRPYAAEKRLLQRCAQLDLARGCPPGSPIGG